MPKRVEGNPEILSPPPPPPSSKRIPVNYTRDYEGPVGLRGSYYDLSTWPMKNLSRKREKDKENRLKTKPKIPAPAPAREVTRRKGDKFKLKNVALTPEQATQKVHNLSYYRALERDFRNLYTRVDDVVEPRLDFISAVRDISEGNAMDEKKILTVLNQNEINSFRNFRNPRIRNLVAGVETEDTFGRGSAPFPPTSSQTEAEKALRLVLDTENSSGKIYGKLLYDKYTEWERGQDLLLQEMNDKYKEILAAQTASKKFAVDFFDVQNTGWRFSQTRRRRRRSTRSRRRNRRRRSTRKRRGKRQSR